jgi:anaerobic magnesium-protoporphyrin IX monomethyl ester cyclase
VPKIIFLEFRRITSVRKNDVEMDFLGVRYERLRGTGFLPTEVEPFEYEDLRQLIVGGWVLAVAPRLDEYEHAVVMITDPVGTEFPEILEEGGDDPIFLMSVMAPNFGQARRTMKYIRKHYPAAPVIVGGVHPTWCPDESMRLLQPDYMVAGECDDFIRDLVAAAIQGTKFHHSGVWNRDGARPSVERAVANREDYQWSWDLHAKYSEPINIGIPNYVGTRSCPYRCHFCGIVQQQHGELSADIIVGQLAKILDHVDSAWIHWETPMCLLHRPNSVKVFEGIRDLNINLSGQHVVEVPTPEKRKLYRLARDAGFENCYLGVETMRDHLRKNLNKAQGSEVIEPCIEAMAGEGIAVNAGWIIGIPGQTADDVKRDMEDAVHLIQKGILAVALPQYLEIYPGTYFWDNAEKAGIYLDCKPGEYDQLTGDLLHYTDDLSKNEAWSLFEEFLTVVAHEVRIQCERQG